MKAKQVVKFRAKEGTRITDNEADIYGNHILKLIKKKGSNSITPNEILEDARNEKTPYHNYFDWDNDIAAEKFRLSQARSLIGSIVEVVIMHKEEVPTRVFVNLIDDNGDRAYVKTSYAMSKPKLANQVLAQALREIRVWSKKYEEYSELANIRDSILTTEENVIINGA